MKIINRKEVENMSKEKKVEKERINTNLDKEVSTIIKVQAALQRVTQAKIIEDAIRNTYKDS